MSTLGSSYWEQDTQRTTLLWTGFLLLGITVSIYLLILWPGSGIQQAGPGVDASGASPTHTMSYEVLQQPDKPRPPLSIPRPTFCSFSQCLLEVESVPISVEEAPTQATPLPVLDVNATTEATSASISATVEQTEVITQAVQATGPPYRYAFPVQPPHLAGYVDDHHTYPATDIFAPLGTEVVAVTDGIVYAMSRIDTWDPAVNDPATRSGIFISILGDDGVRYHGSHLDAIVDGIEPGVRVSVGQLLGYVGISGNARYTPPHLHFGISHPTYPDDWEIRRGQVWPYRYLKAWTQGESLTPDLSGIQP